MTKIISIVTFLFLLFSSSVLAEDTINTRVKSIDVSGLDLVVYKQETKFFFLQCSSNEAWRTSGFSTLSIGDIIDFGKKTIKVGIIDHIEYQKNKNVSYGGLIFNKNKGDTDCIVISDEYQYPVDGKCENIWVLIEGCRLPEQ